MDERFLPVLVQFPSTKTHPAELRIACPVLAGHVVAAAVFLDFHVAFRTFFRVSQHPVGRFTVIEVLLDQRLGQGVVDRILPLQIPIRVRRYPVRRLTIVAATLRP